MIKFVLGLLLMWGLAVQGRGAVRSVTIGDMTVVRGQTNCFPIVLNAIGGENAIGFSLCYDSNLLSFVSARRGAEATTTSLSVNTNQASRGRVGLALALPAGETFASGANAIVEVCLRAAPGGGVATTTLSFCDLPIGRDVVDVEATSVSSTYSNAAATLIGSCSYALDVAEASFNSEGGVGAVSVITDNGCSWSASSSAGWISITSGGSGNGPGIVGYSLAINPDYSARTGTVTVAGQTHRVVQAGIPCNFHLNLNERVHGPAAEFNFVGINATVGCNWAVVNTNDWIIITAGMSGTGDGTMDYWVAANLAGVARTGTVMIANQVFTVRQLGYPCSYALTPQSRVHSPLSEAAIVNVTAPDGCAWYVVNTNDWMIIKLYTNGVGNDIVRYTVFPNPRPYLRSGVLTIGGQPFVVNQLPAPCTYSLLQSSQLYGPGQYHDTVSIATLSECPWTATTTNSWIVISNSTGVGGGIINYFIAPNWTPSDRTGAIRIGNQTLTITQLGSPCTYSISPTSRSISSGSNTGRVSVSTSVYGGAVQSNQVCYWTAINTNPWITVYQSAAPSNNSSFGYTVAANNLGAARTGTLIVAGRTFTISQAGIPCTYSVSPSSRSHGFGTETGVVSLTAVNGCVWTARPSAPWIILTTPTNGVSSGSVGYRLALNTGTARSGTITIGSATFTINQGAATPVTITTQPAAQRIAADGTAVFTVVAAGTAPLSYQWRFNGTNLVDGPGISGATTATMTLSNVQPTNSGNYSVVVSNLRGAVTSANAALTVNTPPRLNPIASRVTVPGSLVTFTASATDLQAPPQVFTYSLGPGAPSGATINAASGVFTWTPAVSQAIGGYPVTVRVTDNGVPPLSDELTTTISLFAGYATNVTLIATGSVWKYRDTGQNLSNAWVAPEFDDTLWASGPAQLGYGDNDEATVLGFGPDQDAKYVTTYFRHRFNITDATAFSSLRVRLLRDDGAVIHLNGRELFRDNMPAGAINYLTFAAASIGSDDERVYVVSPLLDPGALVSANNVVAVEIHQRNQSNSDISFDLELTGTMNVFAGAPVLPASAAPPPVVQIAVDAEGSVVLSWAATPICRYRVQYAEDILAPEWKDLGDEILATGSSASATDRPGSPSQRFYRVVME